MRKSILLLPLAVVLAGSGLYFAPASAASQAGKSVRTGASAFIDYSDESPGNMRKITPADLPRPFATPSASNSPELIAKPADAWPKVPSGFKVDLFATGFGMPRELRLAPNGDMFMVDSGRNQVVVFHGMTKDGTPESTSVFATGLRQPFGLVFYPPGKDPKYVYVANTNSLVRFPYKNGDMKATGAAETLATDIPGGGGHWTRDLAVSQDGKSIFVAVGSRSNVDDPDTHPAEARRANILEYTPEGKFVRIYASGIRNPVGIAIQPETGVLWCSVNERDALGDNLVPDYITHVQPGGFYGWPYFYMGPNEDPRLAGKHPELKSKVILPDVLLQPHNASLQLTFYEGAQFPSEYKGTIFAAEHGSWNKAKRVGYEVIRVPLANGKATGIYEDFVTGFVTGDGQVWGRPVGVAAAQDGSLLFTDDGYKAVWRVSYTGG